MAISGLSLPDSWASVGGSVAGALGGGNAASLATLGASVAAGPAGWVSAGLQVLGAMSGGTEQSGAGAGAELNTSGWNVGEGSAKGGSLSNGGLSSVPWYVWGVGALVAMAIIRGAYKK